jgi:hypothetical protein
VYGPRVGALRMARVPARGLVRERASWSQASRDPAPRAGTGPAKPKVTTGIEPVHGGFADRAVEQRDPAWKAGLASLGRGARHRCAPDSPAGRPSSRQRDAARASPRHRIDEGPRQRRDPLDVSPPRHHDLQDPEGVEWGLAARDREKPRPVLKHCGELSRPVTDVPVPSDDGPPSGGHDRNPLPVRNSRRRHRAWTAVAALDLGARIAGKVTSGRREATIRATPRMSASK